MCRTRQRRGHRRQRVRGAYRPGRGNDRVDGVADFGLFAGPGNDTIILPARWGIDLDVHLGPGDDQLHTVRGPGRRVDPQSVCLSFEYATHPIDVDLLRGKANGEGNDRFSGVHCVLGSPQRDHVVGSPASDYIEDFGGPLTVEAGAGDDYINGGEGGDSLYGGPDADEVNGAYHCYSNSETLTASDGLSDAVGHAGSGLA